MARYVLVPLDGSPAAESAVAHGAAVAAALADAVLLLHVLEPSAAVGTLEGDVDWRLRRAEAGAYLRSVADAWGALGVATETEVAVGTPADEIVRCASRDDVVAVVVAAHGRGASTAFDLGGTCQKVLWGAPTSLLIVRRAEGAPAPLAYRRILVPLDGSPAAEWALAGAAALGGRHGASLLLVHHVPGAAPAPERLPTDPEEGELWTRLERLQTERGARYLDDVASRLGHTGLEIRTRLARGGRIADAIAAVAADESVDLIALSAHGAGGATTPYGGVAQGLLLAAGAPVLVFQDLPGLGVRRDRTGDGVVGAPGGAGPGGAGPGGAGPGGAGSGATDVDDGAAADP
jgi:nucleotide-binding universal stress UspA family protein